MRLDMYTKEQQYEADFEGFCNQNCIQQIMNYYEVKNPYMYMDVNLNVHLFRMKEDYQCEFISNPLVEEYKENLKINRPMNIDPYDVWQENKKKVEAGIPIMTDVDMYYMDYSKTYEVYHSNHCVILAGFEEQKASIIDIYQWKFKGDVELEHYLQARTSECPEDDSPFSGVPICQKWYEVSRDHWDGDPAYLLKQNIERTLENYYYKKSDSNNYYGIEALHKIFNIEELIESDLKDNVHGYIQRIRRILLSLLSSIQLFRYYLSKADQLLHMKEITALMNSIEEDLIYWKKICLFSIKVLYTPTKKKLEEYNEKLVKTVDLEEKRYERLVQLNDVL